jgi:methionyl-tRNA synthetase
MLLSAEVELPREVWAHVYVQWEGAKMSKTSGTAVTLDEAIERHGPDSLRYFLLREVGFEADGNFSWERFDERYNADLADGLGNLASRALAMLVKYRSGVVPSPSDATSLDRAGQDAVAQYIRAMDALDLRSGAEAAWVLVSAANLFVQQTAPWALAKAGKENELDHTLAALARALARLAVMISPFIPGKAQALWEMLGLDGQVSETSWSAAEQPPVAGRQVQRSELLFPKPASV